MDKTDIGIKNFNVLEEIAHVMHMSEMWTDAKEYYEQLKRGPSTDEVCGCVTDLEDTGIMAALQLLAMKIRYPGITSGIKYVQSHLRLKCGNRASQTVVFIPRYPGCRDKNKWELHLV